MFKQKKSRQEKERERAEYERKVVEVCRDRVYEMADEEKKNCNDLKATCERILEEIRNAQAAGEEEQALERMLDDYDLQSSQQQISNDLCSMFNSTGNVLASMLNHLDMFMRMGWYRAVIRFTPEKKLPKLISSEKNEDIEKVMSIVMALNKKLQDYIALRREETEQFRSETQKRNEMYREMKGVSEAQKQSVQERIAKLQNEGKVKVETPDVMPVSATFKAQAKNTK